MEKETKKEFNKAIEGLTNKGYEVITLLHNTVRGKYVGTTLKLQIPKYSDSFDECLDEIESVFAHFLQIDDYEYDSDIDAYSRTIWMNLIPMEDWSIQFISDDGIYTEYRTEDGKLHRLGDKPASIKFKGYIGKVYDKEGEIISDVDEVIKYVPCDLKYIVDGKYHRNGDKPAIMWANGAVEYYKNGKRHRDGLKPAIIDSFGNKEYWENGKRIPKYEVRIKKFLMEALPFTTSN